MSGATVPERAARPHSEANVIGFSVRSLKLAAFAPWRFVSQLSARVGRVHLSVADRGSSSVNWVQY